MTSTTTSSALRIAARRLLSTTTRTSPHQKARITLAARLHSTASPASPAIHTAQTAPCTEYNTCRWMQPPIRPRLLPVSPISPTLHTLRRYTTNGTTSDTKSGPTPADTGRQTNHDRNHDKGKNTKEQGREPRRGRQDHDRHRDSQGPRRKGPAKLTLYAGVSLLSILIALSQPLSFVHIGHHDDNNTSAPGSDSHNEINTSSTPPPSAGDDQRDPSLPRYRLADVRKHDATSGEPWVTSGDKVYDITDWVAAHPGGDVILRAAGHSIDPYWAIFTIHKAPYVREILDTYLIGFVDILDLDTNGRPIIPAGEGVEDPFASDPSRDARLVVHTQKPCNAEPAPPQLAREFTTPNELFYVRNHMWVPVVDPAEESQHRLTVELPDGEERAYTLDELRTRFPRHRVTAVLQCSGNRRSDMTQTVAKTNGLQWAAGAISNAVWEGVLLRDVLADAGLKTADQKPLPARNNAAKASTGGGSDDNDDNDDDDDLPETDSLHVQLNGMEAYAASIPLPIALDPRGEVLLAFAMNGAPLPRDHGYPLRAVVPGYVAARSVKWLSRIVVSDEESTSQWQRRDYKLFGPNEGSAPDWDRYPAIQEMPITSAITGVWVGQRAIGKAIQQGHICGTKTTPTPAPSLTAMGSRAAPGVRDLQAWQDEHWNGKTLQKKSGSAPKGTPVTVTGYAYSGGGREIVRVDVSVDGGRTWDQAALLDQKARAYDDEDNKEKKNIVARGRRDWAWKRWRYDGLLLGGCDGTSSSEIVVKATDCAYNTQPERHDGIYNVRGNLATAWHRVTVGGAGTGAGAGAANQNLKEVVVHGCGFDKACDKDKNIE